jgi:hypothetical protein
VDETRPPEAAPADPGAVVAAGAARGGGTARRGGAG